MSSNPETIRCTVLRAFLIGGKPVKVGDKVDLAAPLAHELRSCNKVEFATGKVNINAQDDDAIDPVSETAKPKSKKGQ